jgi:hypothetical protein
MRLVTRLLLMNEMIYTLNNCKYNLIVATYLTAVPCYG